MLTLQFTHSDVHSEFLNRKSIVKKTAHNFSVLVIDQAHEQINVSVKYESGAVDLTEYPAALNRWIVMGLEMTCVIREFKNFEERRKTDT